MLGFRFLTLLGFLLTATAVSGQPSTSNLEREKNWADQVADTVMVGEAVWLSNRGHKFLSLYTPPAGGGSSAVILLHGRGVHPAWGFIENLRGDIAEAGFHTLSLQMPILAQDVKFSAYEPTFPEAFERIDAGIKYLQQKGVKRILLLGHSSGSMTAVAYVAKHPRSTIAGVMAIGLSTLAEGPEVMQPPITLKSVRIPVLDIYGGNDLYEVVSVAAARKAAAKQAGNKGYAAVQVAGADHFFTDRYEALKKQLLAWLKPFRGP